MTFLKNSKDLFVLHRHGKGIKCCRHSSFLPRRKMNAKVLLALSAVLASQIVTLPPVINAIRLEAESLVSRVLSRYPALRLSTKSNWTISVQLNEPLKPCERIAITGDADFLGQWMPDKAIALNRTKLATLWSGNVRFPPNTTVNYRYFIGVLDSTDKWQIRKWETHFEGRHVELGKNSTTTKDHFGIVDGKHEVSRGWLNIGYILQLKIYRNPFNLLGLHNNQTVPFVRVIPVDYDLSAKDKLHTPVAPSARVNVEVVRFEYGNSVLRDQPEYGVPYHKDDVIIFHITTADIQSLAYRITVYIQDKAKPELIHTFGYQYLYPNLTNYTHGSSELVLMSPNWMNTVGTVKVDYLLITPLPTPQLNFKISFAQYWQDNWTGLDVGHRGLGKSLKVFSGPAPITENTIASMRESGLRGVDMVEFDVHLTSDFIPIVFHDFYVYVCMNAKTPKSKADLTEVLIKDLTYEQLKALKTYQVVNMKVIEYPAYNSESREEYRLFPQFEDFLTKLDRNIGFNIEIKWPQERTSGRNESVQTMDKNTYVDKILDVMLRKGCGRVSFFSSFDADICMLLKFKQNMYPVMFLSPSYPYYYVDPRSDTFEQSINNAQAFDLMGVVAHTSNFVHNANAVHLAKDLGLKLFTWGDDSNSREMVEVFKTFGLTGVIYDRVDLWIPDGKTNVFSQEPNLPKLLGKQCIYAKDED